MCRTISETRVQSTPEQNIPREGKPAWTGASVLLGNRWKPPSERIPPDSGADNKRLGRAERRVGMAEMITAMADATLELQAAVQTPNKLSWHLRLKSNMFD